MLHDTYQQGETVPMVYLNSHTDETLKGSVIVSDSIRGKVRESLFGKVLDYTGKDFVETTYSSYDRVPLDVSMLKRAETIGLTFPEYLEKLDPRTNYSKDDVFFDMTALERQFYRVGFTNSNQFRHLPVRQPTLMFASAHTSNNTVLEPFYVSDSIFFQPIKDLELDPNRLLSGTVGQVEDSFKVMSLNDEHTPYRTLQILSQGTVPREFRLAVEARSGGMIGHGLSLGWDREFARTIPFSFFQQALARASEREHVALFLHIVDVILNGYSKYNRPTGAPTTKASVLDSTGGLGAGETSWIAHMLMLDKLYPHKPDHLLMTLNTYLNYAQAKVPPNITLQETRDILNMLRFGGNPTIVNPERFYDSNPTVIIVPVGGMPDDQIIYHNVENSFERVIRTGTETSDLDFDIRSESWTQIWRLQEGLRYHPDIDRATQVLDLTL